MRHDDVQACSAESGVSRASLVHFHPRPGQLRLGSSDPILEDRSKGGNSSGSGSDLSKGQGRCQSIYPVLGLVSYESEASFRPRADTHLWAQGSLAGKVEGGAENGQTDESVSFHYALDVRHP